MTAIAQQEWQQVEARKARSAAQAERIATRAADRMNKKLESDDDISPSALVPIFGVAVDKMLALRGEASLTIHHEHTHSHQHELIAALNGAGIEQRAKAAVVEAPALPQRREASVAAENVAQKQAESRVTWRILGN